MRRREDGKNSRVSNDDGGRESKDCVFDTIQIRAQKNERGVRGSPRRFIIQYRERRERNLKVVDRRSAQRYHFSIPVVVIIIIMLVFFAGLDL